MLMEDARKEIVYYGRELHRRGFTEGTGGNLSVYDPETGYMAISPTGTVFTDLEAEDVVIMKLDGTIVEGDLKPSSEWQMHALQYEDRDDLTSLIHAHTIYSTAWSLLRKDLPPSHYMIGVAGSNVRCTSYETFGSLELAQAAKEAMKDRNAVLLANHGVLCGGRSLKEAFSCLDGVEYTAKVHIIASSVGEPVVLTDQEMGEVNKKFKTYGQDRYR